MTANLDDMYADFGWMKGHWRTIYMACELRQLFMSYSNRVPVDLMREFVTVLVLEKMKEYNIEELEQVIDMFRRFDEMQILKESRKGQK